MFFQSSEHLHRSTNCTPWRNAQGLPLDGDEGCLWAHRSWTGARERSCCLFCNGHVLCGKVHRWFHSSLLTRLLYDRSHSDYLKATTHRIEIVCGLVDVTWRITLTFNTCCKYWNSHKQPDLNYKVLTGAVSEIEDNSSPANVCWLHEMQDFL